MENLGLVNLPLMNIIMGLLKQTEGKIYVDNKQLSSDKNQLIANIGYVPQEAFLFEGQLKKISH